MIQSKNDYSYNRFGSKGTRVGQAVHDILSEDQPEYTVEDILDGFGLGRDYLNLIREEAERGKNRFDHKFYILSLMNKAMGEMGISNVLKHSCRAFSTLFSMREVMTAHPNSAKTMFEVDAKRGEINLLWTLPGYQECISIRKNPKIYDSALVKNVDDYFREANIRG